MGLSDMHKDVEHKDDMVLTKTWMYVARKTHYRLTNMNYCMPWSFLNKHTPQAVVES
jgi:hypothetical protein